MLDCHVQLQQHNVVAHVRISLKLKLKVKQFHDALILDSNAYYCDCSNGNYWDYNSLSCGKYVVYIL